MKKIVIRAGLALSLCLILLSCNVEKTINRRLDGTWNVNVFFGDAPSSNETIRMTFTSSSKNEGEGVIVVAEDAQVDTYGFSYFLHNDRMTMVIDQDAYVFSIGTYTRREMVMQDTYGRVTSMTIRTRH